MKIILRNNLKNKFKSSINKIKIENYCNMMVDVLGSLNGYTEACFF